MVAFRKKRAVQRKRKRIFDEEFLKKLEYLYIVSKKVFVGKHRAERRSKKIGSGLEFADHRGYSPGDDFRYLDWNVYGRLNKLLLRLYEEEEDLYIYLLPDISQSMGLAQPSKFEYALRVSAALAYIGLSNLDRVSVVPFSDTIKGKFSPARGKGQIFKVFNFLENLEPHGLTQTEESFKAFVHRNKRRGVVALISDFYDPNGYEEGLNYLRYHRFDPFVIHLYDERELGLELAGDLQLIDCETNAIKEITITKRMLRKYRKVHAAFCQGLEQFCFSRQIMYFRVPIHIPFDELILKIFRAGGFLK